MANIQISLQEVTDTASKIRNLNQMMYDELMNLKQEMNALSSVWQSEGADTLRNQFNLFTNRFERQKETIDEYAKFLDLTVSSYDSLESTITSNASTMQA